MIKSYYLCSQVSHIYQCPKLIYQSEQRMILKVLKSRQLNKDEESEEDVSIPLIMRSHPFLHQIYQSQFFISPHIPC